MLRIRAAAAGPARRHRAAVGVLVAAAVAALAVAVGPASGAPVDERRRTLDRELAAVRDALEGTEADLVDAAVALRRSEADLAEAQDGLAGAQAAAAAAKRQDAVVAGQLAVARAAEGKAARDLRARQAQERRTRQRLGRIAREAYLSRGLGSLSIALNAQSPEQFADRVSAVGTALRAQNGAIDRLDVQQAENRARQQKLAAARARVAQLKRASEAQLAARQRAERSAATAAAQVLTIRNRQGQVVRVIASRKAAEQRRVAALEAEQGRLAALLRARAARSARSGSAPSSGGDGGSALSYPVNAPVTSSFGRRFHPVLRYWRLHAGTDFGAPCGTPLRAAASGTVVRAGWAGGYGNQVVVDHGRMRGSSVATSSNHLSRIVVSSGTVRRGQVIGYTGTTGLSTGCHLHFEVYVGGNHVDPMGWL